jgi:7,8-dihydropterin-6-yl-methyl-4-(beta-D-ribofuranosyl)aminobenzene 5'-phosphate synthase
MIIYRRKNGGLNGLAMIRSGAVTPAHHHKLINKEASMIAHAEHLLTDFTITVIYDNYPMQAGLQTAWGFACLIQGADKTILFDTGGDGAILLANMTKLGIDPQRIDLVVLSHLHWDHTGGVYHFLNVNAHAPIYVPHSFSSHFKQDVQRYGVKMIEVQDAIEICPGVYSTGDLDGPIREQSLLLRTPQGMIVITGCAHPGIVKIIQTAKTILPDEALLVMGGCHLMNDQEATIMDVISQFRALGVQYVAASHCTGDLARQMFAREYQQRFLSSGVGKVITLMDH